MQERKENFMIKVFKSIMAAFLVAVMVASCSNGSSGGGGSSDENSVAGTVNDNNSLAGTVWALGSARFYFYEDGKCKYVSSGPVQSGTYDETKKTIRITYYSAQADYTYEISGNIMTLSAGGSSVYLIKES